MHIKLPCWQLDFGKNEETKKKVVAEVLDILNLNISAIECLIERRLSVLNSVDQGLQHIPL